MHLRVKVSYAGESDKDVAAQVLAVIDGLNGNPDFTNPPADLTVLKTTAESFASAIAASIDGGKKATAEKNKQRAIVVKMMRQLGHWVEANCNDDPAILQSSGYQPQATSVKAPPQPLAGPPSFKVDSGKISGLVGLRGKPVFKAVSYMARYAPIGSDGKPGSWTEVTATGTRSITVTGLTPGANGHSNTSKAQTRFHQL